MHGEITANLSTMPVANMVTLLVGVSVLLIIAAVVIVTVVRKLGLMNFVPFKTEHDNTSSMYYMNEKIKDIDDLCHKQMRHKTDKMKDHISNIFDDMNICAPARYSISSAIRLPLHESISNNHFTTEFMPDRYPVYRDRIIYIIKDEYTSLAIASKNEQCGREKLPSWEQVKDILTECIDQWLKQIAKEVMDACDKKIVMYKSYLRIFEETKDNFRTGICKECIEKNERYIRELKHLI